MHRGERAQHHRALRIGLERPGQRLPGAIEPAEGGVARGEVGLGVGIARILPHEGLHQLDRPGRVAGLQALERELHGRPDPQRANLALPGVPPHGTRTLPGNVERARLLHETCLEVGRAQELAHERRAGLQLQRPAQSRDRLLTLASLQLDASQPRPGAEVSGVELTRPEERTLGALEVVEVEEIAAEAPVRRRVASLLSDAGGHGVGRLLPLPRGRQTDAEAIREPGVGGALAGLPIALRRRPEEVVGLVQEPELLPGLGVVLVLPQPPERLLDPYCDAGLDALTGHERDRARLPPRSAGAAAREGAQAEGEAQE